ncbi:MAG: formin, partial [Planctomycetota bacterium]
MPDLKDIILGNIAVERGLVERQKLLDLQKQQRDSGLPLGQVMLRAGLVNGPKLIELMKLVSVTIEHLDGGLEVGADSADAVGPPGLLVGAANEPSRPPRDRNEIPVVPAVGGNQSPPRAPAPRSGAAPAAAAFSPGGPRAGVSTPKPMPSSGLTDDSVGTKTPAPVPSPFEQAPKPVPPPAKPRTDRFEPSRGAAGAPSSSGGYKPKTEAFDFGRVDPLKPRHEATTGAAASAQRPKSGIILPGRPATAPQKPPTDRFEAARAGGRTPSEAFRVELAAKEKTSDVPQVQGAFGQSVTPDGPKKKDNTRLYTPVDIPKATPAGKLPAEAPAPGDASSPISVPPALRENLAGMKEGESTLAGRLPAGIDADSKPLASPLDDSKLIPPGAPPFEMPPGGEAASAPKGRPSQSPMPAG